MCSLGASGGGSPKDSELLAWIRRSNISTSSTSFLNHVGPPPQEYPGLGCCGFLWAQPQGLAGRSRQVSEVRQIRKALSTGILKEANYSLSVFAGLEVQSHHLLHLLFGQPLREPLHSAAGGTWWQDPAGSLF